MTTLGERLKLDAQRRSLGNRGLAALILLALVAMLPGFFSLSTAEFEVDDPLAQEFISWRGECESTIRVAHQILSRGEPNTWNNMWVVSANVMNKSQTPEEGAAELQKGLDSWYTPGEAE